MRARGAGRVGGAIGYLRTSNGSGLAVGAFEMVELDVDENEAEEVKKEACSKGAGAIAPTRTPLNTRGTDQECLISTILVNIVPI